MTTQYVTAVCTARRELPNGETVAHLEIIDDSGRGTNTFITIEGQVNFKSLERYTVGIHDFN